MAIRQLVSILVLPGTVAVVVPFWIARRSAVSFTEPRNVLNAASVACGLALLVVGLLLFGAAVFFFWRRGRGTLAPWDPPRRFVVEGPYRYVRNPMISGIGFVLIGEALILRSRPHAEWAAVFAIANAIYIPLLEEPMLIARFGEAYDHYKAAVPRFVPRRRPWVP